MALGALAGVAGAVLGGIAGAQGDRSRTRSEQTTTVDLQDINSLNKGRSTLESTADTSNLDIFKQLQNLFQAGPGQAEVTGALNQSNDFAAQIQAALQNGGLPNATQVGQANSFANSIFAPQQVAMQQGFEDQRIQGSRLAAKLGRSGADPILQAKLAQEQTRQSAQLNAQQGAYAAQYADQLPQRQLQLGEALTNLRNGLASQALSNRSTLLQLGQTAVQNERNYRLSAANRTTSGVSLNNSGGGTAGAISGGLAGIGAGMSAFSSLGGMGGSGASGGAASNATAGSGLFSSFGGLS